MGTGGGGGGGRGVIRGYFDFIQMSIKYYLENITRIKIILYGYVRMFVCLDRTVPLLYGSDERCLEDILLDISRNHLNISPVSFHLFSFKQVDILAQCIPRD